MGEVAEPNFFTLHSISADDVLKGNVGKFSRVLLVGVDRETGRVVAASSTPDLKEAVWLATKFVHKCHDGSY